MSSTTPMLGDLDALHAWAREHHASIAIVDEDWESITFEARTTIDGELVRCRFRDILPLGMALRRWARTYVIGLWHTTNDGAECHHVREVITPCLASPERPAREQALTLAGALIERDRRQHCGATAETLHAYLVERAVEWRS